MDKMTSREKEIPDLLSYYTIHSRKCPALLPLLVHYVQCGGGRINGRYSTSTGFVFSRSSLLENMLSLFESFPQAKSFACSPLAK